MMTVVINSNNSKFFQGMEETMNGTHWIVPNIASMTGTIRNKQIYKKSEEKKGQTQDEKRQPPYITRIPTHDICTLQRSCCLLL